MRIGRTVIIPAILVLGVAGTVLAGAEISAASASTPMVNVQHATVITVGPDMKFRN